MPSQKRPAQPLEDESAELLKPRLDRIRNMWQFANLCQWIYIFGKAAKIDESIDIEVKPDLVFFANLVDCSSRVAEVNLFLLFFSLKQEIETECLKPDSTLLADIALALLKLVSSHRGLTHSIFDAQARKQYAAKSPGPNPFGADGAFKHFADFDVFTKIKVLQQLTQWAMIHPERLRDNMEEQKDTEQASWRIEPYGWDSQDRTYYVLDDNRIYRLSQAPVKKRYSSTKIQSYGSSRRSKRRRVSPTANHDADNRDVATSDIDADGTTHDEDNGLGGMAWECIAVTLAEVQNLLATMARSRDENEKILIKQLRIHLVPILEKQEEARKRRELQRERELLNIARMANAKRSSRIAHKVEQQMLEEKARAEQHQIEEAAAMRRREEKRRQEVERERESRLFSREKRLQEREARRLCHEQQMMQLSAGRETVPNHAGRVSERQLQAEIDRNKQALRDLDEDESWIFDCVCGLHGQVDDGAHSVACERCNVWQHSKCLGISVEVADRPDFHFICSPCSHHRARPDRPQTSIKVILHVKAASTAHHDSADTTSREQDDSINELLLLPEQKDFGTVQPLLVSESPQTKGEPVAEAEGTLAVHSPLEQAVSRDDVDAIVLNDDKPVDK